MPSVRRFHSDEWQLYRDLRLAALRDAPDAFGSTLAREEAFSEQEWIARLAAGAASSLNHPIVAEDGAGRAVGLAWVRIEPTDRSTATLYQVWIHPHARRRQFGLALLASAVRWAREAGARTMELHVALGPDSVIAFIVAPVLWRAEHAVHSGRAPSDSNSRCACIYSGRFATGMTHTLE